jgi:3-oxoacyl-[acyl-carrier-protein] synthase II
VNVSAVITGLGSVCAWGWGVEALWRGLETGETRIGEARRFNVEGQRTRVVAEVPKPPRAVVDAHSRHHREWCRLSRADRYGVAAAVEAWGDSPWGAGLGLPTAEEGPEIGVFFGGSTAGMAEAERFYARVTGRTAGPPKLNLLTSFQLNGPGDAVARRLGAMGPVETVSSACASGGLAIGAALEALRRGEVSVAVAGGADSLTRLTYSGFNALRAVDAAPCRPFRADREGLSLGEGAGVVVLETPEHARRRGARVLAAVVGTGASCDAHHMTAPHPEGLGAAAAIRRALADAGIAPTAVRFINAHGTGTPLNDASETAALVAVFGDRAGALPVTSTKGSVGHLLGSSGALEAVATVLCLHHGQVHATPGGGTVDPALPVAPVLGAALPLAASSDPGAARGSESGSEPGAEPGLETGWIALSTSFAFGGSNAAVVFRGPSHPSGER